ncbi:hypothetical protein FJZ31_28945, partial [Candidatus Poribacteria bacterium]|nr:hypothetical protein [Candidatus Poribacteria bacterium]
MAKWQDGKTARRLNGKTARRQKGKEARGQISHLAILPSSPFGRKRMRESKLKLYISVAILSIFCSVAYSSNEIEKGPYLQNVGKKYITIMWETTFAIKSRVDYGITEDCNLFVEDAKEVKLHEVTLYPLRANTRYYYKITCGL